MNGAAREVIAAIDEYQRSGSQQAQALRPALAISRVALWALIPISVVVALMDALSTVAGLVLAIVALVVIGVAAYLQGASNALEVARRDFAKVDADIRLALLRRDIGTSND
jgi:hypothetical protein